MNTTINAITPHFCESLYAHYSQLAFETTDPDAKAFYERRQQYYLDMHEYLVPFSKVVSTIEFIERI